MIKRWIVQIEWYPFLGHRLPRIRVASAPYPGKVVYTKGWGWRKLLMCDVCSGDGYFDASVNDPRTVLMTRYPERREADLNTMAAADEPGPIEYIRHQDERGRVYHYFPGPQSHAEPRADARRSDYTDLPTITGERVSDGWQDTDDDRDWAGREPETPHYECPDYPCHKFHDA